MGHPSVVERVPYLKELGVTVLELMPIFQRDPQEGEPSEFFTTRRAARLIKLSDQSWSQKILPLIRDGMTGVTCN